MASKAVKEKKRVMEPEERLLSCVLGLFSLGEAPRFPEKALVESIYKGIYVLSETETGVKWLGSLAFDKGPAALPISDRLEKVLFRLGAAGLISVDNPDYRYLRIEDSKREAVRKLLFSRLQPGEIKELKELSEEFARLTQESGTRVPLRASKE